MRMHSSLYNITDLDGISGPVTQIFVLPNCAATRLSETTNKSQAWGVNGLKECFLFAELFCSW